MTPIWQLSPRTKPRPSKYPHEKLDVGAEVIHTCDNPKSGSVIVYNFGRKTGRKFTVKILEDAVFIRRTA